VSATILVLEENAAVLELIDQSLRESGHRVLCTKDAYEAIEVVGRVRIDVVVAGVLLAPGTQTLVCQLRSIQPGLHVIGICDPDDELQKMDRTTRLSSPLSLGDLREVVAASLEQQGSS
jgi:DNA-binding NtrC family response regulator